MEGKAVRPGSFRGSYVSDSKSYLQGAKATEFHAGNKNTLLLVDMVRSILKLFPCFFPSEMVPQFLATFYFVLFLQVSFKTSKVDDYYIYSYVFEEDLK